MLAYQLHEYGLPATHQLQEPLYASPEQEEIVIRNEGIFLNLLAPLMVQCMCQKRPEPLFIAMTDTLQT